MTTPMTTEEIAVGIVEMRLAGVHPHWIRWFTRGQWHQREDIRYVLRNVSSGDDTYVRSPYVDRHDRHDSVIEFLEETLKEKQ